MTQRQKKNKLLLSGTLRPFHPYLTNIPFQ